MYVIYDFNPFSSNLNNLFTIMVHLRNSRLE